MLVLPLLRLVALLVPSVQELHSFEVLALAHLGLLVLALALVLPVHMIHVMEVGVA